MSIYQKQAIRIVLVKKIFYFSLAFFLMWYAYASYQQLYRVHPFGVFGGIIFIFQFIWMITGASFLSEELDLRAPFEYSMDLEEEETDYYSKLSKYENLMIYDFLISVFLIVAVIFVTNKYFDILYLQF